MTTHSLRLLYLWFGILLLLGISLMFPHREVGVSSVLNVSIQLLLSAMCVDIALHSVKEQKHIYIMFALLFGLSVLTFSSVFVGTSLFKDSTYSPIYFHVYVNKFGLSFVFFASIVFVLVDYFGAPLRLLTKYVMTLVVAVLFLVPLYSPFLKNPLQLYYEPEYSMLRRMNEVSENFVRRHSSEPTNAELAQLLSPEVGAGEAEKVVGELRPFLNEGGMMTKFWKPLGVSSVYVNAVVALLLALFFLSNYLGGRPHSAYLDKILLLFFVLTSVEIVHLLAYFTSTTLYAYDTIFIVAQYVTILCLLLMVYALDLRRTFVRSATGKYYEDVLKIAPENVTRWRDEVDNAILRSFFDARKYNKSLGHYNENR